MNEKPVEGFSIRQADWRDAITIQRLLNSHSLIHRYLDWRDPLQWLGPQPYLLLEKYQKLHAVLSCPTDPPNIAWIRLFACSWEIALDHAWDMLVPTAMQLLSRMETSPHCYILALEDWIDMLMRQRQYRKHQELVILERGLEPLTIAADTTRVVIRPMVDDDLPDVEAIDVASFEDLWVYSLPTLQMAFQQSGLAYLAEIQGKAVGYLLGTISGQTAHLARIAVLAENTRQHVASHLIERFFKDLGQNDIQSVTLNTQSNNQASLALYDKMGFRRTGEAFGVYQLM